MATTHDMRYEEQHGMKSTWSWLLPLAIVAIIAIALASYFANNTDTSTTLPGESATPSTILDGQ